MTTNPLIIGFDPIIGGTVGYYLTVGADGRLSQAAGGGGGGGDIIVGTTNVTGGVSGTLLYDNAGVVGEMTLGSGVATALGINTGSSGAVVVLSGAVTPGNIPILTSTGIQDSGQALVSTMAATTVWSNNTSGAAAPQANTVLTLGNGSASAPIYSFNASTSTGVYSPASNQLGLAAGGNRILNLRSGDATSFWETIYSGGGILRMQGGTNVAATVAANGTSRMQLANNGAGTNGLLAAFAGPVTAGGASNYLLFTVGDGGSNGPTISPVVQGTGTTEVPININPITATSAGVVQSTGMFVAKAATAIQAGAANQAFIKASSTANFGVFYGTGDPSFSAAKSSLYVKTNATTTTTRLWVNTDGSTGWANFTASA